LAAFAAKFLSMARQVFRPLTRANQTLGGFALRDLLAVIAVLTLLGTFFPIWRSFSRNGRDEVMCLANGRQMMRAFALYSQDYNLLPPNEDVAETGHNWIGRIAGTADTNRFLPSDPRVNLLAPYARDGSIWKCPADRATILVGGRVRVPTVRSVSMNGAVGTVCIAWPNGHSGAPVLPTHGPWLDGVHTHLRGTKFRTFGRDSDFVVPGATFVFLDEHPPSLNDGVFAHPGYSPQNPSLSLIRWIDFPADYHGKAGGITFGDGHAEIHRWRGLRYPLTGLPNGAVVPAQRADWEWLATHATQPLR
jgi:prepilin-type processing-associated H-X9-DG protein